MDSFAKVSDVRRRLPLWLSGSSPFAICLLAATAFSLPARAETGGEAAAPQVPEVIVTAQKRISTVQSTPISVTAITGNQLRAQGIAQIMGVITGTPGISVRSAGPGQTELEMRGLSSSGGSAPTVGFYLDETPLSPPAAALNGKVVIDPDLFDLDRVEVLRGPQGTLYGSGSMGGTVKLVTNQPNMTSIGAEVSAEASATEQGGANGDVELMVNAPIVADKAALRVVATEKEVSGWIDRVVLRDFPLQSGTCPGWSGYGCFRGDVAAAPVARVDKNVNHESLQSVRSSLLLAPTSNFQVNLSFMDQHLAMGGYSEYDVQGGGGHKLAHYEPADIAEPFSDDFILGSAVLKYSTPAFEVTSANSYWSRAETQTQEDSESIQNIFFGPDIIPISITERDTSRQFSSELRFSSTGNARLSWVAGGFYSSLTSVYKTVNQAVATAEFSEGGAAANPEGIVFNANNPYNLEQYALFGEITYSITPHWSVRVGARWFEYNTSSSFFENGLGTESGNAVPMTGAVKNSASGTTPSFNISYKPDNKLTVYGQVSKGWRPGGVNLAAPVSLCGELPLTYQPDSVWNYEVGEKARLFNDRLEINSDFYYMHWLDVQQYISPPCGYPYTANAGSAASYGPEIEVKAKIGQYLTLSVSGAYTSAKLISVTPGLGLNVGDRILNVPQETASASLTYRRAASNGSDFVALVSNDYVGRVVDIAFDRETLPSYDLLKARVGLDFGNWSVFIFGDNLLNQRAILSIDNTGFDWLTPALTRASTNQPRTAGVRFDYKFR
jgi:outer membrane receptor protein involved in Fe transport